MFLSIIIPVYNRPEELSDFLESLAAQTFDKPYELIIVEDGSTRCSKELLEKWKAPLHCKVSYYFKSNTGPGDSRNFGMMQATGDYFLLFDSDCIFPKNYLQTVDDYLTEKWVPCFGGPDDAHPHFSTLQKAITVSMTSVLTTGGVRGQSKRISKFQPRSFNMGISRKAFEVTQGFSNIHPGEDPELVFRLWEHGFETELLPEASVFHKRRISFSKFRTQVLKFGKVRPILDVMYPQFASAIYAFPLIFCILLILSVVLTFVGQYLVGLLFGLYFFMIFLQGTLRFKSFSVGVLSIFATIIQFFSYAQGYALATLYVKILKHNPENVFPELFFKKS